jgi:hypothetical protein
MLFRSRRAIQDSRMVRDRVSILECVRKAGYPSEKEFWNDFLSEWMEAADFCQTLEDCRSPAERERGPGEDNVMSAIEMARADNEPWFRLEKPAGARIDFLWLKLDPLAATQWLLGKRLRAHLVPVELAQVVLGPSKAPPDATSKTTASEQPAKYRRKRWRMDPLIEEMRKIEPSTLRRLTQKEMAHQFRASPETCVAARREVLQDS